MATRGYRLVVLAAQRKGEIDPLAACYNISHKCLVPMRGRPLIAHVVQTAAAYPAVQDVVISVERDAFDAVLRATASPLRCSAPVRCVAAAGNIADSVLAAAEGHDGPLIITTADNALLVPTSLDAMVRALQQHDAALKAAEVFRDGGQFAKQAGRIVAAFGVLNLLLLRLRMVSLSEAAARISARLGVHLAPVILADGSQAIDVDNERTYAIVSNLLEKRQNGASVSPGAGNGMPWSASAHGARRAEGRKVPEAAAQ